MAIDLWFKFKFVIVLLIEPTVVNGGILEVKSAFLSNGLVFTGTVGHDLRRIPSIRIPKGLLNKRSDGQSMYACTNVYVYICRWCFISQRYHNMQS